MVHPKKVCSICNKGYRRALSRSHSMQATIRRLQPNLQWLRIPGGKRIKVCTRCIKSVSAGKIKLGEKSAAVKV